MNRELDQRGQGFEPINDSKQRAYINKRQWTSLQLCAFETIHFEVVSQYTSHPVELWTGSSAKVALPLHVTIGSG